MKQQLLPALLATLVLVAACGGESVEVASPLSVLPERAMVSIVLNDPAGMIRNIDGYIEEGAPILGSNLLENLVCQQLDVPSIDSLQVKYGFDPSGQIVLWMTDAAPTSLGMAVSAPDFPLFISLLEEMGVEFTDEEPVDGVAVYSMEAESGTMYLAGVRGVALMAMSAAKLGDLITGLSTQAVRDFDSTSLTMSFNLSIIGPMAVAQMPMARMMITQGMAADTTVPGIVPAMMDVYMDGIEAILSQTDLVEVTLVTGAEDFVVKKRISFVPGSALAGMTVDSGSPDMLRYLPRGDLATVRFQMSPDLAYDITKAFTDVFSTDIDDGILRFWSLLAANGAVSVYSDDFIHIAAAYELNTDVSIEDVAMQYSDYLDVVSSALSENGELMDAFAVQDNGIIQLEGTDYYSMTMTINTDSITSTVFNYWLTVDDGVLLLETAERPDILVDIISGDYTPAELDETGEMAGEMSLAGYLGLIMAMSPHGMDMPEIGSDVTITWNGNYTDDGILGEMVMDGSDAVATGIAFFGLITAMQ